MFGMTLLLPVLGIVGVIFPVEASQDAGLQEIRNYGLSGVLIPETTKLLHDYVEAANYAKSRPCGVVTMSQLEECSTCMMEKCIDRAKHICSTNRFFHARATIEQYIWSQLPDFLSPGMVDLSADEALSEYEDFIQEYQGVRPRRPRALPEMCNSRSEYISSASKTPNITPCLPQKPLPPTGKRFSHIAAPFCPELRQNHTACAFFLPECPCTPLCVNYLRALEAKRRFLHAVPGFLRGYSVEMVKLDLATFNYDLGGFTLAVVQVVLDGETYEFSAGHPTLPYTPRSAGQLIAEQALKEYYRKYPSRQTPLSAISK